MASNLVILPCLDCSTVIIIISTNLFLFETTNWIFYETGSNSNFGIIMARYFNW